MRFGGAQPLEGIVTAMGELALVQLMGNEGHGNG